VGKLRASYSSQAVKNAFSAQKQRIGFGGRFLEKCPHHFCDRNAGANEKNLIIR
jgi:hypothetical protein